jgi:ABC-type Fe3+-hydroxamate transport system substrate-binding protein
VQPESITVSMFNVDEGGTINAEADPYIANHTVFDLLGLDQTPLVKRARAQDQFYVYEQSISMELLPQFDGDVIFVPYWGDAPGSDIAALQASPLWQRLNAVQKNQAYIVPGEQWYGLSYQPLFNILDALEGYLLDRPLDTSWEPPR